MYREQLHAAPPGWAYRSPALRLADATAATKLIQARRSRPLDFATSLAEAGGLRVLSEAGWIRRDRVVPTSGAELIHSGEILLSDAPLPYVLDTEAIEALLLYQRATLERPWARSRLQGALEDDRLRYLMPWSDWAARGIEGALGAAGAARLRQKILTVRPAIRPVADRPRERGAGPLRLLFIGTRFLEKGGPEAVRALALARTELDVVLDLVSYVPPTWQRRISGVEGLRIHLPGGQDVVRCLYGHADVLLFPSHMDTFGFVVLEANAHALPVLAPAHGALPELVAANEAGLLFASEAPLYGSDGLTRFRHTLPPPRRYLRSLATPSDSYVESIASAIVRVGADAELYGRLSMGALQRVQSGPFSVDLRRELLAKLYADAT
jgi:glycosyltransferase involved in cell wall biosynthesis